MSVIVLSEYMIMFIFLIMHTLCIFPNYLFKYFIGLDAFVMRTFYSYLFL